MVAKSVIEIDVLDNPFEAFKAKFLKYQQEVAEQPSAWKRIGASVKKTDSEFMKLGKTIADTVKGVAFAANRQQAFAAAAAGTAKTFTGIVKSSWQLVGNLKAGATVLMKWSGIIGLLSGVIGAGGLFGIGRLAASASQNRRESQGLGVSGGELSAAQINYQKLVNVDEMLGNINNARNDVTKRWAFSAAGLSPAQMQGKSNAEVMTMLVPLLKSTFERSGGTQQGAQAHGLLEFADMSTLTRLKAITKSELDTTETAYRSSLKQLAIADNVNRAWQSLEITFKNSGSVIEKMFKEKLVSLTGPLDHLSSAFTSAVKVFLDSPKIGKWIESVAGGLEGFSKYLVSDTFTKNVNTFLDGLDEFGGALISAGRFMGKVFGIGSEKTLRASEYRKIDDLKKFDPALAEAMQYKLENPEKSARLAGMYKSGTGNGFSLKRGGEVERENIQKALAGPNGAAVKALLNSLGISTAGQSASGKILPMAGATPAQGGGFYASLERQRKLPAGMLSAIEWQESRGNTNAVGPMTKYGTAKGAFQWMDHTRSQYGVSDPFNKTQAATGAAWKMSDLMTRYKGDISKALAAYNWGEGNLDRKGMENAPSETRQYVKSIMDRLAKGDQGPATSRGQAQQQAPAGQTIRIENNTGGSAVVIGSQIAQ